MLYFKKEFRTGLSLASIATVTLVSIANVTSVSIATVVLVSIDSAETKKLCTMVSVFWSNSSDHSTKLAMSDNPNTHKGQHINNLKS